MMMMMKLIMIFASHLHSYFRHQPAVSSSIDLSAARKRRREKHIVASMAYAAGHSVGKSSVCFLCSNDACCLKTDTDMFLLPFVCLFAFLHDISNTDVARITILDVQMFHDESWKANYFGVKRSRS